MKNALRGLLAIALATGGCSESIDNVAHRDLQTVTQPREESPSRSLIQQQTGVPSCVSGNRVYVLQDYQSGVINEYYTDGTKNVIDVSPFDMYRVESLFDMNDVVYASGINFETQVYQIIAIHDRRVVHEWQQGKGYRPIGSVSVASLGERLKKEGVAAADIASEISRLERSIPIEDSRLDVLEYMIDDSSVKKYLQEHGLLPPCITKEGVNGNGNAFDFTSAQYVVGNSPDGMYAMPYERSVAEREIGVVGTNGSSFRLLLDSMHRRNNIRELKSYVGDE